MSPKKTVKADPKTMKFEEALELLEEIAEKLENGELGLDESIEEFEKGIELARLCQKKIETAERKIEILQKGEKGVTSREVSVSPDSGEIADDEDLQGSLL